MLEDYLYFRTKKNKQKLIRYLRTRIYIYEIFKYEMLMHLNYDIN